jgi:hypothetical protein
MIRQSPGAMQLALMSYLMVKFLCGLWKILTRRAYEVRFRILTVET